MFVVVLETLHWQLKGMVTRLVVWIKVVIY